MNGFLDFVRVTEVTSVLTDFSLIDPEVLKKAADRGSRVHKYCEMYAKNLFIANVDEDCKNYFNAFVEWFDNTIEEVFNVEERIFDDNLKLTGCIDLVVKIKGDEGLSIIDLKTPASTQKTWKLQTAAYKILFERAFEKTISRRACLLLPKNGNTPFFVEHTNHINDTRLFLNLLELYKAFK